MDRRNFLRASLGFVACAPAIVRASSLMPVRSFKSTAWFLDTEMAGPQLLPLRIELWPGIQSWWGQQFEEDNFHGSAGV